MNRVRRCRKCDNLLHPKNKSGLCSACYLRDNPSHRKLMAKKRKTKEYKEYQKNYNREWRKRKKLTQAQPEEKGGK